MIQILGLNLLTLAPNYQGEVKSTDQSKVTKDSETDQFIASNKSRDLKSEFMKLAKGEIPGVSFTVNEDDFKISSKIPKTAFKSGTEIELEVNGQKLKAQYFNKGSTIQKDKPGFYFLSYQGEDFGWNDLDTKFSKGSKVTISKIDVPIFINLVETAPYMKTIDLNGDNQDDVSHADLILKILEKKLDNLKIRYQIRTSVLSLVKDGTENLKMYTDEKPDILLAPIGSNVSIKNEIALSKEIYLEEAADLLKDLKLEKPAAVMQDFAKDGVFVLASAGNKPKSISAYLPLDGIIGVGANDDKGNIAEYSARNSFVDTHGKGTYRINIVTNENGSLLGIDINGDKEVDFNMGNSYAYDDDIWEFVKGIENKKAYDVTYSDSEVANIISKIESGSTFGLLRTGQYEHPALVSETEAMRLKKVFNTSQFNKVLKALNQDLEYTENPDRHFFIFEGKIIKLQESSGVIKRMDVEVDPESKQQYTTINGTSYAVIETAVKIAKSKAYLSELNGAGKRDLIGIKE